MGYYQVFMFNIVHPACLFFSNHSHHYYNQNYNAKTEKQVEMDEIC